MSRPDGSLLEPLKRLVSQYWTVMAKMIIDHHTESKAKACLELLLNPYVMLGLTALIPLIEAIDVLIQFAQKCDVFIQDFVAALKVCEGQLFSMYADKATSYSLDDHYGFKSVLECSHFDIHTKSVMDLNDQSEMLAFVVNGEQVFAVSNGCMVNRAGYQAMATRVKAECTSAAEQPIVELQNRFPSHNVLNAMGIVYPQYWAQADCMDSFGSHLQILKDFFYDPKDVGRGLDRVVVPGLLSAYDLNYQQSMFKLAMSSNFKAALEPLSP